MLLRRAVESDSEAIRLIYNTEVLTSTATLDLVPRSPSDQAAWMSAHSGVYPVLVADAEGVVAGFSSLSAYRPRPGYATAVEDSVYVAEGYRGRGVGRLLLNGAVEAAVSHGFHSVIGRIVTEQMASIALHKACGFEIIGIEREVGRKFGRWLDVALAQRML
ncbi:MAG TPA: GNAT family N-acetyltransferase [Acidimicrobiales bacterium]|nr:GNAT family N-acetyltransferase [Acidimicrobiales bacterium]